SRSRRNFKEELDGAYSRPLDQLNFCIGISLCLEEAAHRSLDPFSLGRLKRRGRRNFKMLLPKQLDYLRLERLLHSLDSEGRDKMVFLHPEDHVRQPVAG